MIFQCRSLKPRLNDSVARRGGFRRYVKGSLFSTFTSVTSLKSTPRNNASLQRQTVFLGSSTHTLYLCLKFIFVIYSAMLSSRQIYTLWWFINFIPHFYCYYFFTSSWRPQERKCEFECERPLGNLQGKCFIAEFKYSNCANYSFHCRKSTISRSTTRKRKTRDFKYSSRQSKP